MENKSSTSDCGCSVWGRHTIKYCPLHASAPALLAALETLIKSADNQAYIDLARAAINKAKGE